MSIERALEIKSVPIATLVEDPKNARRHPDTNLAAIKESLTQFGQVEPLVVRVGTNVVVGGNGRMRAMSALGWPTAQVIELDITDQQAAALSVALNRTGELAEWDEARLGETLAELQDVDFNFDALGFDVAEIDRLIRNTMPPDFDYGNGSSSDDASAPGPPNNQAVSHVRMVQLFLNVDTILEFHEMVKDLSDADGTENTTDTVMEALRAACGRTSSRQ